MKQLIKNKLNFNIFKEVFSNNISLFMLIIGLFIYCYPMILSAGALLPGSLGDARIINYFLEHGWLFVNQHELHTSLFDMPMFFPHTNTLSYSDMMIGGMLVYIPIRLIIKNPITALQLWFILLCIFNYYSMYFLLNKIFKFDRLPSAIGALLFAFGLPRQNHLGHIQYQTQFYMILSLIAFLSINKDRTKLFNNVCFLFGSLFFVLQIYSSFYMGWFMVYGFAIYLLILFSSNKLRFKLFDFIKYYKYEIILYSLFVFILLIPLLKHYLAIEAQFDYETTRINTMNFTYKTLIDNDSYIDNIKFFIDNNISREHAYRFGIGYITLIIVLIAILLDKIKRFYVSLFVFISIIFFINLKLNYLLFLIFPGASAIRLGERIIFLILPIFSYYLAFFIQKISTFNKKYLFLIIIILIEQISTVGYDYKWTKEEHIKLINDYTIPIPCNIYYDNYRNENEDNIFVTGIYKSTLNNNYYINGYSGYTPHIYPIYASNNCIAKIKE